jgi:hypothetical protein
MDKSIEYFTLVDKQTNSIEEETDIHYEILDYQLAVGHIPESKKYQLIKEN